MANYIQVIVGAALSLAGLNIYRRAVSLRAPIAYSTSDPNFTLMRRQEEFRL